MRWELEEYTLVHKRNPEANDQFASGFLFSKYMRGKWKSVYRFLQDYDTKGLLKNLEGSY